MYTVSVIVPVYNVEKYLRRCVDSILSQTFQDFELILVDDGSPDSCPAICDEYAAKDSRVTVIHKKNGGVSSARNAGLDIATGKYIAFCDSDDWCDIDFLDVMVASVENIKADVVVSNFKIINYNDSSPNYVKHFPEKVSTNSARQKFEYIVSGILSHKHGWEIWTRIFRNDIIQKNKIRFCTTCDNYAEDLGFVLEYCLLSDSACSIDYCGYNYFQRQGSMMRSSTDTVKLNSMNEVSAQLEVVFRKIIKEKSLLRQYPLIHFLIMRGEYVKLIGTQKYDKLHSHTEKIIQYKWYRKQTYAIRTCRKEIEARYGKKVAHQILLLSHYCLHGNWKLFKIESAIAYRWFIK